MTLLQVKVYEAKFLGMPLETVKGKLVRSKDSAVIPEVGEIDTDKKSPTYGKRVCKVNQTYKLDEFQVRKVGGAFDMKGAKEVKGYVLDDGETPEEANALSPDEVRREAQKEAEAEEKARKEKEKEAEARKKEEEKVGSDTPKTKGDLEPKGKFDEEAREEKKTTKKKKKK